MFRTLLYIGIAASIHAIYQQIEFLMHFINYPENPVRQENLAGMFLVGLLYSIAWVGILILVNVKKSSFLTVERIAAYTVSSLVVANLVLSLVLDFAL